MNLNVELSDETHKRIKELCAKTGLKIKAIIEDIINKGLDKFVEEIEGDR